MTFSSRIVCCLFVLLVGRSCSAQQSEERFTAACVGFYNLENLFDTIDSPDTDDAEFLPNGAKQWGAERYAGKLERMATVIARMGVDVHPNGIHVLGVSEVENRGVLEDLVKAAPIASRNYKVVHSDSPDRRGIDVGLLYDPRYFKLLSQKSFPLNNPQDTAWRTRSQLLVKGVLEQDTIHFIVAHWPSRRGGEKRSKPLRMYAGKLGRHIVDSILATNSQARIIYLGDLNDDPIDVSVAGGLMSTGDKNKATGRVLYNPMVALFNKGIGTGAWRDSWNLFDQILLSPSMLAAKGDSYHYYGTRVFNEPFLRQKDGNFEGYPLRSFVGDTYQNGYSDHFPVFVILVKPVKE